MKTIRGMLADPLNSGLGILCLMFAILILNGCASDPVARHAPTPIVQVAVQCIPIRTWTAKEQDKLAEELSKLASGSVVWTLEKDWQAMRDAARACSR